MSLMSLVSFSALAEEKPAPPLTLQAIQVEPASPSPDTLCHLTVAVKNTGERPASALEMAVKVGGRELPAYRSRVFLMPVEPGATRQVRLFNFWSSEAGRPAPADGKLTVEVTLAKASWMQRETQAGAMVWTPAGPVPGLPSAKSVTVALAKATAKAK
jgi:hypothetical protein